jgi:hypothetical protein
LIVNVRDFVALAKAHLHHDRIIVAAQVSWILSKLIVGLDQKLSEIEKVVLIG